MVGRGSIKSLARKKTQERNSQLNTTQKTINNSYTLDVLLLITLGQETTWFYATVPKPGRPGSRKIGGPSLQLP